MSSVDGEQQPVDLVVGDEQSGARIDVFLAQELRDYSRVSLRRLINAGTVTVEGNSVKASTRLRPGQRVHVEFGALPRDRPEPENIPLEILYEDEHLAAVNKPAGMVVHPAKGHWAGTLASALTFHFDQLSTTGGPTRPGIVHRLDRDTSGVIVVAKTDAAHVRLAARFEAREVEKEYFAIVAGVPDRDRDEIRQPIGIHPYQREKMAIRRDHPSAREAETFFEVLERFDRFAALCVCPRTGRTHQVRVHLAHAGCPVLCDRLYGGRAKITHGEIAGDPAADEVLLARQALHARRLKFAHPITGEPLKLEAPLAEDVESVLEALRAAGSRG